MANFASNYILISKLEFKKVGKNNTSLLDLQLMEPISEKQEDGSYKVTGHNFFNANIWGERATKGAMELEEGTKLDLSPTIEENDNGQWVKYKAKLQDESWEYTKDGKTKTYHKAVITIFDYEIRD